MQRTKLQPQPPPGKSPFTHRIWWVFLLWALITSYGWWADKGNAYDRGRKDAMAEKTDADYARGKKDEEKTLRATMAQENASSVEIQVQSQVQARLTEKQAEINGAIQQAYQRGIDQTMAQVIKNRLQVSIGPPPQPFPMSPAKANTK